jgi:hypothetical protein
MRPRTCAATATGAFSKKNNRRPGQTLGHDSPDRRQWIKFGPKVRASTRRCDCISHILKTVPVGKVPRSKVKLPQRSNKGRYDDQASLKRMIFVGEGY